MPPTAAEIRREIAADPFWFPRVVLGRAYWSKQADLYRSLHTRDRVVAHGGQSTGKTKAIADRVAEIASVEGAKIVLLGPKFEQIEANLWSAVKEAFTDAARRGVPLGGELMASSWRGTGPEEWIKVAGANREESLRFGHGEGFTVVVDEATNMPKWAWSAVEGMMASERSRLFVSFNPTNDPDDYTRKLVEDTRYAVHRLSCLEHPNVTTGENIYPGAVTRAWVEDFRKAMTDGRRLPWQWDALVEGKFPSGAADALLGLPDLEASLKASAEDVPRLGLDVARFGDDRNVLVHVDSRRQARIVEEWAGQDLMFTAGRLMRAVRELGVDPRMTFVDSCGVGGGVVDRCREAGVRVTGVDAGSKATGRWAALVGRETPFANRRAELFWTLRCICKSIAVMIPRDFWADVGMLRVGYRGTDLAIRSKDDMRKEFGRSPDRADALALAFAAPASTGIAIEVW